MSESSDENKNNWLALLKWSLAYTDGTIPSDQSPNLIEMSEEDKAFLEEVMKNGVVNEGDRMKVILSDLVSYLDSIVSKSTSASTSTSESTSPKSEDEVIDLLEELQDIVEQIDFAGSFAAMGGLQFLIGCASSSSSVPKTIRCASLAVLATMCQNNPSVQFSMLEQGNLPKLMDLYYEASADNTNTCTDTDTGANLLLKIRVLHVLSCTVRNHDVAEKIYCMNERGIKIIESALLATTPSSPSSPSPSSTKNLTLRRKALFLLQALVTSDTADQDRIRLFTRSIQYVACDLLTVAVNDDDNATASNNSNNNNTQNANSEIREMGLSMISRILQQKKNVNTILDVQSTIVSVGVPRVSTLRSLEEGSEEKELTEVELNLWESIITDIARTPRDAVPEQPLLLEGRPTNDAGETIPQ